jgi:shikimate dehydrogenase
MKINTDTQLLAVLGNPVHHSLSPAIHNAAIEASGLNYIYTAFKVENMESAIAGMRGLGIRGYSVTIPHKLEALRLADELDPIAQSIGSANTLINNNGVIRGYNTDGIGALRAINAAGVRLGGAEVTIMGSGGAGRAIACTLAARSDLAKMNILSVEAEELKRLTSHVARQTSARVEGHSLDPDSLKRSLQNSLMLINCTPVGMHPHIAETLVPAELLVSPLVVFDVVYNPMETRLLHEARERRCRAISGVEMFIYQAVEQFELFTGQTAPEKVMRKVVLDHLKKI